MAKKNVKLPKGAIKKLAKAYAQLEQRRREEEAILALGPSLQTLHDDGKRKRRKRSSRRSPSPERARSPRKYSRRVGSGRFVGPVRPMDHGGSAAEEQELYRREAKRRKINPITQEEMEWDF